MMGLTDILGRRAASQGRTAAVSCGELGRLTVEALPVRELELLLREPDGARKVFYAACRELQRSGEELRKAGQIYQPDGILQFVSVSEAEAAARTVLELSGWRDTETRQGDNLDEIRLSTVQNPVKDFRGIRPEAVQNESADRPVEDADRPALVQFSGEILPGDGQDSHESQEEKQVLHKVFESDGKPQGMERNSPRETQNVVSGFFGEENGPQDTAGETRGLHESESEFAGSLHEMESEYGASFRGGPHEITSEFPGKTGEALHETKSVFRGSLHEIESEIPGIAGRIPHEIKSEFPNMLHETESDFSPRSGRAGPEQPLTAHEIKSELQKILHETESELGECVARQLLEGLRRAKWVRGG